MAKEGQAFSPDVPTVQQATEPVCGGFPPVLLRAVTLVRAIACRERLREGRVRRRYLEFLDSRKQPRGLMRGKKM